MNADFVSAFFFVSLREFYRKKACKSLWGGSIQRFTGSEEYEVVVILCKLFSVI